MKRKRSLEEVFNPSTDGLAGDPFLDDWDGEEEEIDPADLEGLELEPAKFME